MSSFGDLMRKLRTAKGMSLRDLERLVPASRSHLSDLEHAHRKPDQRLAKHLDRVLDAGGDLLAASHDHIPQGDDMRRRSILGTLTALAAGTLATAPLISHEAIRQGVEASLGDPPDSSDWDAIIATYAHDYHTTTPTELARDLSVQLVVLQRIIEADPDQHARRDLQRTLGYLSVLMALAKSGSGQSRAASAWWATARRAATRSGDPTVATWAQGEESIRSIYERRPLPQVIDLADQALGQGLPPTAGKASLLSAKAQALSMLGRGDEARATLAQLDDTFDRLPPSATEDDGILGYQQYCLWHTRSYVYTHLGETPAAYHAQDQALALYSADLSGQAAMVQLHRARCQIIDGNLTDGLAMGTEALDLVNHDLRTRPITELGQAVLNALPTGERTRPAADELRQRLVTTTLV